MPRHNILQRILVVAPAWIGDMVMAHSLFRHLKAHHPLANIDVLAPAWTRPLLERMPEVNEAIALPFEHGELALIKRWRLGRALASKGYQQAIILPNSWKSALIPFAAKIPVRTGWRGEMRWGLLNDMRHLDKKKLPLMYERFLALGQKANATLTLPLPKPIFTINPFHCEETLKKYRLTLKSPIIGLCPGAEFGASKRWPANYYAQVAQHFLDRGFQVWLFGSQKDQNVTKEIQALTAYRCVELAGKTSLSEAIDLLSFAHLVITNDSGLMHIAAALERKIIAIYGSTDPGFTPPLSESSKIVSLTLPCRPCFQRECPLKHHHCMKELLPETVIKMAT